jgi:hypothetical protein
MNWEPMSVDEFARYKREEGMKLVKIDGIWWAEVRPCFFRPLVPFREIEPWSKLYPPKCILGGFLHVVPPHVPAKSCINFHVYDDLKSYSLDALNRNRRKQTRRGLKNFTDRPIVDLEEFAASAYDIYKIFYKRTNYWYKSNRTRREEFYAWAEKLYDYPKIDKTGVFRNGKLSAIVTSFQVEDIIFGDNLFSDNESLSLNVIDYIMHRFRETAASTDAKYFFSGLPTGKATLDASKLMRGCKLLSLPAYCKINPISLSLAKFLMKDSYHKLKTVMAPGSSESQ